jgi:hypothetical protein
MQSSTERGPGQQEAAGKYKYLPGGFLVSHWFTARSRAAGGGAGMGRPTLGLGDEGQEFAWAFCSGVRLGRRPRWTRAGARRSG